MRWQFGHSARHAVVQCCNSKASARATHIELNVVQRGEPAIAAQHHGYKSKFLGILFDRKLSFIPHIKYLKAKCLKALNLLKVLSHTSWGADRTTLLKLYRSIVWSKLDYGCIIYGSARKSYLQMLDPIHNQGLKLALGAFRTSPVARLYVEADEPSLYSRREKLSLQYAIRLAANPSNPTHEVTFPPNYVNLYEQKP